MTRTISRRSRLLSAAGALVLAGGALAGCSAQPGAAASVTFTGADGTSHTSTVSNEDVQDAVADLGPSGVTADQVLQILTRLPVAAESARAAGVEATDEEAAEYLASAAGLDDPSDGALDVGRYYVLDSELGAADSAAQSTFADDFAAALSSATATISPRYSVDGEWLLSADGTSTVNLG